MDATDRGSTPQRWALPRHVALGIAAGCFAGVPQVLAAQLVGKLVGSRGRADVGPRLVHRASQWAGRPLSRPAHWSLAGVLHFAYAAGWGAAYAATIETAGAHRVPSVITGGTLGALIYAIAFSRLGLTTLTGAERHPDRRGEHEWAVQLTSAFSFALVLTYTYRWGRERA
jgi:hypothetical protein